jgi:hypothetical protein
VALIDESREAFRELRDVMPATIVFNGIEKTGVSHSINFKRAQHLQNYQVDATSEFEMEDTDYAEFVEMGLKDRVSEVSVNGGRAMVVMATDTHVNSATVHVFLSDSQ